MLFEKSSRQINLRETDAIIWNEVLMMPSRAMDELL